MSPKKNKQEEDTKKNTSCTRNLPPLGDKEEPQQATHQYRQ